MKEHLRNLHLAAGHHHAALAQSDKNKAELYKTAAAACHFKSMGEGLHDCFKSLAAEHEDSAATHARAAQDHINFAKSLGPDTHDDSEGVDDLKAAAGTFGMTSMRDFRDFSKLQPTAAHGVLGDVPNR